MSLRSLRHQAALLALPLAIGLAITAPLQSQSNVLKLATIAPTGSPWHNALLDMGVTWNRETAGRVKVTVFANNSLGDDPSIVRNMRLGQIQMSMMMLSGLALIDDGFNALGIPFFFRDDAEVQAVEEAITPTLDKRIAAKGFHLLSWTQGGWVQIFSKSPIKSLDELKKTKLWTSEGDTRMVQWYKTNGFNPVALSANDIGPQLKLGMVDATPSPAFPAMLVSLYKDAPNMLNIRVAPLLGALVISTSAWNAISVSDQAKMTAAAKVFETRTSTEVPKLETLSIEEMQKRGLTVTALDKKASDEFHAAADTLVATMRGNMVPADVFDAVKAARDAFRRKTAGAGGGK